jgi:hypothetical protein
MDCNQIWGKGAKKMLVGGINSVQDNTVICSGRKLSFHCHFALRFKKSFLAGGLQSLGW